MSRPAFATLAALLVLTLVGCAPTPAQVAPSRSPHARDSAAVDSIARKYFAMNLAPGMSVAVVRGDETIFLGGFGFADREKQRPVTPETVFYLASVTKAFTGLTAAILDERGTFDLDAPLGRYLPDARLQAPLSADSITIRSLLSHTHGIGNSGPVVWRTAFTGEFDNNEQLVRLLAEHAPARGGRAYAYGNIGYNIASFAMDRAVGRSWKDVLADEIFGPLDMRSSTAYVSRIPHAQLAQPYDALGDGFQRVPYLKTDRNMQAAGGLVSSARDLSRWLEAQLNGGRLDGKQVLSKTAVAEAQKSQAIAGNNVRGLRQIGYSLGWQMMQYGSDTLYVHGGGFTGFAAMLFFLPRQKVGVAVLANEGSLGGALTDVVGRSIIAHFGGAVEGAGVPPNFAEELARARAGMNADRARRAERSQVLVFPIESYVGVYTNPLFGTLELRLIDGRLRAFAGAAQSPVEVYDASKNQLRVELSGNGEILGVEMENGRAARITLGRNVYSRR